MAFFDYNNGVGRARFYFAVRWYLHQNRRLLHLVQILRAYLVLGPLRNLLVKYYQTFGHTAPLKTEIHPDFPQGDPTHIVTEIHERGYAHVGQVPAEEVTQILDYCRRHQHTRYWNPHTECEAVNRLCRNATLVEIARRYLGAEPILWLTLLRWSFPLADERADFHPAPHQEPRQYNTHAFHYDILDFKSLTLFVYLTDVESASGAHIVVEGTHNKRWHELHHLMLDDRVVEEKFGERIHVIMGKKGTAFFEETSTYHKVEVCQSRRLILSIDYVLQRTPPPQAATVGAEAGHTPVGNHTCHIPEQSGAARIQAQGRGRGHAEQRTVDWRCAYTMDTYGPALVPRADAWQPLASRGEHACGNPEAKRVRHLLANRAKGPFTLVRNEIDCTRNVAFR